MTDRLNKIFNAIPKTKTFADVGCDHGYIAKEMLDSGKCEVAIISDVSAKCLKKAETLLNDYVLENKAIPIVSDGFKQLPKVDTALIAGMGGMEIISILEGAKSLPETLILQPMNNCQEVRTLLLHKGYKFILDEMFYSLGKFYDLIVAQKGQDNLTLLELEFGRDNLKNKGKDFLRFIEKQIKTLQSVLENGNLNEENKAKIEKKIERLRSVC